jgi:hypothetical protein
MDIEPGIYRPEFPIDSNFTMVPNARIRDEDLGATAKLLMIYLFSHKVGYQIHDDQVIRETGLGRHALRTARKQLEELEFIQLVRVRQEDNSWGGYRYELSDPKGYFSTVGNSTVEDSTVGHSTVENRPDNRKPIPQKTKSQKTMDLENQFSDFWSLYPRKVGKQKALAAFEKAVDAVGLDTVMNGARRLAADPNLPSEQWIPHPTTWLNEGRWDDDPYPPPAYEVKPTAAQRTAQLVHSARDRDEQELITKGIGQGPDFGAGLKGIDS